jgi:hypothetical protein
MVAYILFPELTVNFMGASLFNNGTSMCRVYLRVNDIRDYDEMK